MVNSTNGPRSVELRFIDSHSYNKYSTLRCRNIVQRFVERLTKFVPSQPAENSLQDMVVRQQATVGCGLATGPDSDGAGVSRFLDRSQSSSMHHDRDEHLHALAVFVLEDARVWTKAYRREAYSRQHRTIQVERQGCPVDPGSADSFKWRIGPSTDGKVVVSSNPIPGYSRA